MKVIFLDIDGVLQPYGAEYRFYEINNAAKALVEKLSRKHNIDYSQYSIYDVLAAYYDWDDQAVARLKYILDTTSSRIIVSSDWRSTQYLNKMRDLLTIRGLGEYWLADNKTEILSESRVEKRAREIQESLKRYSPDNYLVLDDMRELKNYFPNNMVLTHNCLSINDMHESIKILKL